MRRCIFSGAFQKCPEQQLTCHVGELVLQGADVRHIYIEEGSELGHRHAYPGDRNVCQATAAVHWEGELKKMLCTSVGGLRAQICVIGKLPSSCFFNLE